MTEFNNMHIERSNRIKEDGRGQGVSLKHAVDLRYAATLEQAFEYRNRGYEPVECSFGDTSVVGPLKLDHHGVYSEEEPVSVKAARIAMQPDFKPVTRFVVTGLPDPDAVYALLVLSGNLEPDLNIAKAIAELDIDPVGINRTAEPYIRNAIFEMKQIASLDIEGYKQAINAGLTAFKPGEIPEELKQSALLFEELREVEAKDAIKEIKNDVAFVVSDAASRDIWHRDASLVVQYKPGQKVVTVSGCSEAAAKRLGKKSVYELLGDRGFDNFYSEIDAILGVSGSGGRSDIGGTPRGEHVNEESARKIFEALLKKIKL
ncbi:MAG: hypothetical protein D6719_06520 [Candidatus Dadabacteria bacterium]|nr:MAG: hypothetical protein D6719_06520 [Candidatus Dadabacteria bacterium]